VCIPVYVLMIFYNLYSPYFRHNTVRHMNMHLIIETLTILDLFIYREFVHKVHMKKREKKQYNKREKNKETHTHI